MPSQLFTQLKYLFVFYRSTLEVSVPVSFIMCPFVWPNILLGFGLGLMTIGTVFSLLYRDLTFRDEYYFYYNLGITKSRLIIFSIGINIMIGIMLAAVK